MTWFRVDDHLHAHPKAMRAGVEAMGLWCLAGSWSGDQLTDGWIPEYAALRLAPNAEDLAARLVRAGLWLETERDGERGWQFHEWTEQQPTRHHVLGEREKARKRMAEGRERRRQEREVREAATAELLAKHQSGSADVRANTSGTFDGSSASPTRPDPTRPELLSEVLPEPPPSGRGSGGTTSRKRSDAGGTRLPEDWQPTPDLVAWAKENCPDIDGRYETEQFIRYWHAKAGKDARKADWPATFRSWVAKSQKQAEERATRRRPNQPARSWSEDPAPYQGD